MDHTVLLSFNHYFVHIEWLLEQKHKEICNCWHKAHYVTNTETYIHNYGWFKEYRLLITWVRSNTRGCTQVMVTSWLTWSILPLTKPRESAFITKCSTFTSNVECNCVISSRFNMYIEIVLVTTMGTYDLCYDLIIGQTLILHLSNSKVILLK